VATCCGVLLLKCLFLQCDGHLAATLGTKRDQTTPVCLVHGWLLLMGIIICHAGALWQ
jgi:hypothetical protein